MKTKLFIPFLALYLLVSSAGFANSTDKKDPVTEKDKVLISVLNYMLSKGHYVQKDLNDEFSVLVFNSFIDGLDPSKRYFTQKDIKGFSMYKYQIDNQLKESDLTFYSLVYGKFLTKIKTVKKYYEPLLKKPINRLLEKTIKITNN